jgi:hypothetical protein
MLGARQAHPVALRLPLVQRRTADPVTPAAGRLLLAQYRDDLLVRKPAATLRAPPLSEDELYVTKQVPLKGQGQATPQNIK